MIDYEIPSDSHHYPWYKSKDKINLVSFFNIEGFDRLTTKGKIYNWNIVENGIKHHKPIYNWSWIFFFFFTG
jgi:hypothetical protein